MKIKVLGSGCPTCKTLYESVLEVVEENKDISVEYITDINALIEAGIMTSPALLIDDDVVCAGRLPSQEEIKEYVDERKKQHEKNN